jgi:glycosyltransferase involved in cell wall biosynthesis
MQSPLPLVSVLMLTHNHEAFLDEAIRSVQAQTLQNWELMIGEDGSTDHSSSIAFAAAARDPRIHILTSPEGALGFHSNFARLLASAKAPYVAFLEGDDWWSEPRKLELQVARLEQDVSLAFCGGYTQIIDQRSDPAAHPDRIGPSPGSDRLTLSDLIQAYSFHFSSVLMRRDVVELPSWIYRQYCLDRPLYLLAACHGDAGVIQSQLSVYRLHGGGAWAPLTSLQKSRRSVALFTELSRQLPAYRSLCRRTLSRILWSYLADALKLQQRSDAFRIFIMAVKAAPALRLVMQLPLTLAVTRRLLQPRRFVVCS